MSAPLDTRARELVALKDDYERKSKAADIAEKRYREAERELWIDLQEQFGKVTTVTFEDLLGDGQDIQLQRRETITASILNKTEAAEALLEEGYEEAVETDTPGIRKRVLNQIVRNRLKSGQGLPKGVDFHPRRYIAVTKKGS